MKANRVAESAAELVTTWASSQSEKPDDQRPEDVLLAEHQLMRAVMSAMQEEVQALLAGKPLRPDFWSGAVDFIGNFIHRVHREKEERCFFPLLVELKLIDAKDQGHLERDHDSLKSLTLALCEGVSEGDWEKALRIVSQYLHIMSSHLDAEELRLTSHVVRSLPDEQVEMLRQKFHDLERAALTETSRLHYLELTRNLCRLTGQVPAFDAN